MKSIASTETITKFDPFVVLNDMADAVEVILERCNLPGKISGGYYSEKHVRFSVQWECNPLEDVEACKKLTTQLQNTFKCKIAGVGKDDKCVWLYGEGK